MKEIVNFKTDGGIERINDKFGRLIAEAKKIDLGSNLDYAMTLQFVDRLEKDGKIGNDEKMRLIDEIETKEGKPKAPNIKDSSEKVQKELRQMKVINNRDKVFDEKVVDTHYIRESSRYGKWKNQMKGNGFQRSNSNRGSWKYEKDRKGSQFRS